MTLSVAEQLAQLNAARQLVLADAVLYPQIIQGVLPIVGVNASIEIRRWGADFLAETFASLAVTSQQKQSLSIVVLQTLRELLELPGQDIEVLKNVVQAAAGVYGHVFRHVVDNPKDSATWQTMVAIKSSIFKRWDTFPIGVRICCIKFAQRVVQIQTMGPPADPRRPESNETSLALVSRDHPLVPPSHLGAEASALLDRLLDVFIDKDSDAILVDATLNCLTILIRTRPASVSDKIVNAILNFNPIQYATGTSTSLKTKIQIRSMERTLRALLMNLYRKNENGPFALRIRQHIDRVAAMCFEVLNEGTRKRGHPAEPSDGLDNAKRQRLGAELPAPPPPPPLPEGPISAAQLYTLTSDQGLTSFDVKQLPFDLMVRIFIPILQHIDKSSFDTAIGQVRTRHQQYLQRQRIRPPDLPAAHPHTTADEDYEPDFEPEEDAEQIQNKQDGLPAPQDALEDPPDLALGTFKLPQPPQLTLEQTAEVGKSTINRVFGMMNVLEDPITKKPKTGFNRLAGSSHDKDAWITIITRIATRAPAGLEDRDEEEGDNGEDDADTKLQKLAHKPKAELSLGDGIRETLRTYILEDFRNRISTAISWLTEEWYNDAVQSIPPRPTPSPSSKSSTKPPSVPPNPKTRQHYPIWSLRLLDGMLPYLDAKDAKHLIRFLGEMPAINRDILDRVKSLAKDPERVKLTVDALHYLVLVRPPARNLALDVLEELWQELDDAKTSTAKVLQKWRPSALPKPPPPASETFSAKPSPQSSQITSTSSVKSPTNANVTSGVGGIANGIVHGIAGGGGSNASDNPQEEAKGVVEQGPGTPIAHRKQSSGVVEAVG